MDDPLDLRPIFREHWPSRGPDSDSAIEFGIDIAELERNQSLTPEERLLQLRDNMAFIEQLRKGMADASTKR